MKLNAEKRVAGDTKNLRRTGRLPAVVYNNEMNVPVTLNYLEFDKVFRAQGTSQIIDLDVEGETHEVLVREVQMDKRRREPIHVDFYKLSAGQEVDVAVELEFTGKAAGFEEGGQLFVQRREVQIRVLPRYIPDKVEVDISALNIGDSLHVGDIVGSFPRQAQVIDEHDLTLVTLLAPTAAEEETADEEAGEPEVISRGEDDGEGSEE